MRLTQTVKAAFIRAVLEDIPQIDYQAETLVLAEIDATMAREDLPALRAEDLSSGVPVQGAQHLAAIKDAVCLLKGRGQRIHEINMSKIKALQISALEDEIRQLRSEYAELRHKLARQRGFSTVVGIAFLVSLFF